MSTDCYRTPQSGGHKFAGESDLVVSEALRKIFPFVVECKHRNEFRTSHLFHPTQKVKGYHAQVMLAVGRDPFQRFPLLVMRGSDMETYASTLAWDLAHWAQVELNGRDVLPLLHYQCNGNYWAAMPWERFLTLLAEQAHNLVDYIGNLDKVTLSTGCVYKDINLPCENPNCKICLVPPGIECAVLDLSTVKPTPALAELIVGKPVKEADAEPPKQRSKLKKAS